MGILEQALAIVERQQAAFTAQEQMDMAHRLRQMADELEAAAMLGVDYELIADALPESLRRRV